MDKKELKVEMLRHGDTNRTLAEALEISPQRLSAKINETNGAEFSQGEITKIKNRYNLSNDRAAAIYLN